MKKLISFVLCLAMLVGCSAVAFAELPTDGVVIHAPTTGDFVLIDTLLSAPADLELEDTILSAPNTEIETLMGLGIVQGDGKGNLNLDSTIIRAEVCATLMRVLGHEQECKTLQNEASAYTDVLSGLWYNGYVLLASRLGLVNGIGKNKFNPNGNVVYEEAIAFVVKALGYKPETLSGSWPMNYVGFAQDTLKIGDSSIALGTVLTRAQMFHLLYQALELKTVTYDGGKYVEGKTFAELAKDNLVSDDPASDPADTPATTSHAIEIKNVAYDYIKVAAVEAVGENTTGAYVEFFVGKAGEIAYYLDEFKPVIGEIYVNIPVEDSVAQMSSNETRLLSSVTAKAHIVSGATLTYPSVGKYTNLFKDGSFVITVYDPEIWIYDAATYKYSVFSGTVEEAYNKIESADGYMNLYDSNGDSTADFIVVYPNK